jgi:hypothetical protein
VQTRTPASSNGEEEENGSFFESRFSPHRYKTKKEQNKKPS